MSILDGVASEHFKTFFYDIDDSIGMLWKGRYGMIVPRHEAINHFGTVGMMQIYFAKLMETDEVALEEQGIHRALFEVLKDNNSNSKFHIIKDSINVNQLEASINS
ncbi:hypothetical protein [Psychrobacter sp. 4Bb]|uniref:hypothetical protein n=1 Tax=Psychrobacter sp. 4Bb TaxID=888436 RepID=UPI000C7D0174|nr:hypothetical protein [Psychrobacter sp. 4Bb]PKH81146.1 hypothetical protein CXF60_06175 [Psychrobacter sp. 4Bb]